MQAQFEEVGSYKEHYEQGIDEKKMNVICQWQCYQGRKARASDKKIRPSPFKVGDKVLKQILPNQVEVKGKNAPN